MATSDLAIRIATVLDSKGLNKAQKGLGGLEGAAKKLAKQVGAIFAADKIISFGKASAQAFMDDQKEAVKLANAVRNLGLEFANPVVAQYVDSLSRLSGVADSELRPALQTLIQQTGNLAKAQELLGLAISVSRGSGESLSTVTNDLAQAYVGNTKGLKKYYLGLTQAELKAMSFTDVQKRLTAQFAGASAAYLATYAGQMEMLNTAAGEAKETIGRGLVESLGLLAGDKSVSGLASDMQDFADYTANATYGLASLASQINVTASSLNLKQLIPAPIRAQLAILDRIAKYGEVQRNKTLENASVQMFKTDMANMRVGKIKVIDTKKVLDNTKKLTAEQKKQAALKQAGLSMDLSVANLIAALKGNLSDEDRKRAELQLALQTDNVTEAQRLTKEIALSQGLSMALANTLASLPAASNPFAAWKGYLDEIELQAKRVAAFTPAVAGVPSNPVIPDMATTSPAMGYAGSGSTAYAEMQSYQINVQVDGKTIASALMDQSLSGNQAYVNRRTGGFD